MKVVIVDNEKPARKQLAGLLLEYKGVEICGDFATAPEALDYIEKNPVEVVFLDIHIPGMDGIEMAKRLLDGDSSIQIVFVTCCEGYALAAFELNAADYLLKPVSRERFSKTIRRLKGMAKQS